MKNIDIKNACINVLKHYDFRDEGDNDWLLKFPNSKLSIQVSLDTDELYHYSGECYSFTDQVELEKHIRNVI